jgi:hypothetical protein
VALVDHCTRTDGAAWPFGARPRGRRRRPEENPTSEGVQGVSPEAVGTADWVIEPLQIGAVDTPVIRYVGPPTGPATKNIQPASGGTSEEVRDSELAQLEAAANARDERALASLVERMDWPARPAEDYVRAVRLALSAGAHLVARRMAVRGHQDHPGDPVLAQMARILAPPKATRLGAPADPILGANRDWFVEHGAEYRGQWVAVKAGRLLGHAPSLAELQEIVPNWREATVTRVS